MTPSRPQLPMSEDDFQIRILGYCKLLGLLVFHDYDSRRNESGFPDLVIVGKRVLFVELKKEDGRVKPKQQVWLNRLEAAGAHAQVWRPSDWDTVKAILQGLR